MESFRQYVEINEVEHILVDCDVFTEWGRQDEQQFLEALSGWLARQAGNAGMWGLKQAGRAGMWSAKQAGRAATGAADLGMKGLNRAGQGLQNTANRYDRWRDPVSRLDVAMQALDKVDAAYGHLRTKDGATVERVISKIKRALLIIKQNINQQISYGRQYVNRPQAD